MAKKDKVVVNVNTNNKSNKGGKGKRRGRKARKGVQTMGLMRNHYAHMVCSITNAFCPQAEGARIPDNDTQKTLTYCSKDMVPITTDANGSAAIWVTAAPSAAWTKATTIVANGVTVWGSSSVNMFSSTYSSSIDGFRVVTGGVRIISVAPFTSAQGVVVVTEVNNLTLSLLPSLTSLGYGLRSECQRLVNIDDCYMLRSRGSFTQVYSTALTDANRTTNFLICFSGCAASTVVAEIEMITNYEWVPIATSGLGAFATPSPGPIGGVMEAAGRLAAAAGMSVPEKSVDKSYLEYAEEALESIAGVTSVAKKGFQVYEDAGPVGRALIKAGAAAIM